MICWVICSLSSAASTTGARECFERAIAIAPLLAGCYYDLVRCHPVTNDDGLLQQMEAALATPGLEAAQRVACTSRSARQRTISATTPWACNISTPPTPRCAGSLCSFDSAAFAIEIDRLIARCTPEWIARAHELGSSDATPVFILGMPRSGTTLVEQIVSNHPQAGAGGELHFWNVRGAAWHRSGAPATEAYSSPGRQRIISACCARSRPRPPE